ncbi:hypothetical protein ADL12_36695 [Streptomyces regalis]|uniref:Uncharacterized protein n=1 Tax=Streptomyces regalis TaxID=68262 RepID=A0A101JD76_9ACTN|nr:hypothetical protein ADL12_36695 [Streptomyces regalis]
MHLALAAGSAAVLLRLPETVRERLPLSTVRPQRPGLPAPVRAVFGPAAIASFVGFALFGVDVDNHAVSGLVVAPAFFASIAGQLAVGRGGMGRSLPLGSAGLLAGPAFRGALAAVAEASLADRRAAMISTLFVVAYAGISVSPAWPSSSRPRPSTWYGGRYRREREGRRGRQEQRQGVHPLLATLNI